MQSLFCDLVYNSAFKILHFIQTKLKLLVVVSRAQIFCCNLIKLVSIYEGHIRILLSQRATQETNQLTNHPTEKVIQFSYIVLK